MTTPSIVEDLPDVTDDSPMSWLRVQHEKAKAAQEKDVRIPGVPITITIRPVDYTMLKRIASRALAAPESRRDEAEVNAWASGVGTAAVKWTVHHPDGDFTANRAQLAEAFGLSVDAPWADVVRAICLADGDIKSLYDEVERHSGFAGRRADEEFAGE